MITVWSTMNPAIATMGGVRRIVGGTVHKIVVDGANIPIDTPIPEGLDLGYFEWIPMGRNFPAKIVKESVKKVKGSSGKMYTVKTFADGRKTCTCPGYTYRRFCKHTGGK
jgi:hypothetical protein